MKAILFCCLVLVACGPKWSVTVEHKCKCPSEEIWVSTEAGMLHFEAGEIDEHPPYIKTRQEIDDIIEKLVNEENKRKGT
jgi:hypothetical protein